MNENTFAFPHEITHLQKPLTAGMTLRDYFAAKAMQGWLSTYADNINYSNVNTPAIAYFAYQMADAMMEAREE
jgi:hypothetical protein